MSDDVHTLVNQLDLEPHPEGGYYRETYRTPESIPEDGLPERFDGKREAAAQIYYLLPSDTFSALHRIQQAEVWHFYAGDPLTLHLITPGGTYQAYTLGHVHEDGQRPHAVVPAETWFGATVNAEDGYTLVGCTTAPAFDFADFELADREALVEQYPQHREVLERLTR